MFGITKSFFGDGHRLKLFFGVWESGGKALFQDIFTTEDWVAKQEKEKEHSYFHFPGTNHNICKSKQSKMSIREPFKYWLADFVSKFS